MTDHQIEKLIDQAAKSTKPIARVVRLDSAMATELLARAATNREVRRTRVARYRADMEGGHWVLNGEPMIISSEGKLIDGQHRCLAIQGTEAAVDVLLVLGVHPLAMATMGQGVPRTAKKASVIFSGWNAFRSGRSLKSIRVSTRLPMLAGAPPNGTA